jgi:hypothetical protein
LLGNKSIYPGKAWVFVLRGGSGSNSDGVCDFSKEKLMSKVILMMLLTMVSTVVEANNRGCAEDEFRRVFCAPAGGGTAVSTPAGVVCAPGHCATDNLGDLKCSKEMGGIVSKDDSGSVVCSGGCISPTKEFCHTPR